MADIDKVTVDELIVADTTEDGDKLIIETGDGKVKSVSKKNLLLGEASTREAADTLLQGQITTLAGESGLEEKANLSLKGSANGLAELDENGKIPMSQIPGGADDIRPCYGEVTWDEFGNVTGIEVYDDAEHTQKTVPESNIVYLDVGDTKSNHYEYMWAGDSETGAWGRLGSSIVIGESASNAYRGDRGKIAYDHSQTRGTGTETENNPHALSPTDIGLGNVPNVTTNNQTPTYEVAEENAELESGETLSAAFGKLARIVRSFIAHLANKANPHEVTKAQVGLGDVENYGCDTAVTSGSENYITSGAVYAEVDALDSAKQPKTMYAPVEIDGTSESTVEGAIGTLAGKVVDTVKTVETLPTSPDIQTRVYKCDGRYYIGDGTAQTVAEISLATDIPEVVEYVDELPTSGINNVIYAIPKENDEYRFYAGNSENQTAQELGGAGGIEYVESLPTGTKIRSKVYGTKTLAPSMTLREFLDTYTHRVGVATWWNPVGHYAYGNGDLRAQIYAYIVNDDAPKITVEGYSKTIHSAKAFYFGFEFDEYGHSFLNFYATSSLKDSLGNDLDYTNKTWGNDTEASSVELVKVSTASGKILFSGMSSFEECLEIAEEITSYGVTLTGDMTYHAGNETERTTTQLALESDITTLCKSGTVANASYAAAIGTQSSHGAIGNESNPVYVDEEGYVRVCTSITPSVIDLENAINTLAIEHGGTGADTVAGAKANLALDKVTNLAATDFFTAISNASKGISATIGGTTKSVSNIDVDKVDGYHVSTASGTSRNNSLNALVPVVAQYFTSTSGYIKYANGLIINWGCFTDEVNDSNFGDDEKTNIYFPYSYTTGAVIVVTAMDDDNDGMKSWFLQKNSDAPNGNIYRPRTGFRVCNTGNNIQAYHWIAFGY